MIVLRADGGTDAALRHALFELADRTGDWNLIGSRMVLHVAAAGRTGHYLAGIIWPSPSSRYRRWATGSCNRS